MNLQPHLTAHEPLLVNLLGHCGGALIFGIFLALLWRSHAGRSLGLTRAAALAALLWNLLSLIVLFAGDAHPRWTGILVVLATSSLSLLPALLLDLSLGGALRAIAFAGYAVSAAAVVLHASELLPQNRPAHTLALALTEIGFAGLTIAAGLIQARTRIDVRRIVGAMALLLFALSFSHFQPERNAGPWLPELLIHHAGIPLALFILLQDYRFVLLDAFLRFLANILLAAGFVTAGFLLAPKLELPEREQAFWLIAACCGLVAFSLARNAAQSLLTRLIFRRTDPAQMFELLRTMPLVSEDEYLAAAGKEISSYFGADPPGNEAPQASAEVRRADSAPYLLALGRRSGGRRYLSEDLALLRRFAEEASLRLELYREEELRQLVAQAELRALQAQIHPHFLFNALNTLYGLIPRTARGARQTVLDLADILRFFFRTGQAEVRLEEEMRIVEAYLAIEALRLGDRLTYEIAAEPETMSVTIPVLTIQPLVENAVRHGVTPAPGGGRVRVEAHLREGRLRISVSDSGPGFPPDPPSDARPRVGLENVKKRLRLRYGAGHSWDVESAPGRTVVTFNVPVGAVS